MMLAFHGGHGNKRRLPPLSHEGTPSCAAALFACDSILYPSRRAIEASRENKTALLRPLMARWFSESGRRVLDVPLTRQFRCPTICQIASRLEGELSLSFFPPVAFICIGIYRKKGEEKGQIERTPPFPRCHFCAVCNSETRRFYLTRFPR